MPGVSTRPFAHLNGNRLCVVDCETSGDRPGYHDLIQVCILPLGPDLKPDKVVLPFYTDLVPKRPENWDLEVARKLGRYDKCAGEGVANQKDAVLDASLHGIDPDRAADHFEEWLAKLKLADHKKISPLAQNWPFDRGFLIDWLGPESFNQFFDPRYRDTMAAALFLNDRADWRAEAAPHAHVNLKQLAKTYDIPHERAHDALQDCLVTAEVYRRMLMKE